MTKTVWSEDGVITTTTAASLGVSSNGTVEHGEE